jgi:prolyl 4-hydroxylase
MIRHNVACSVTLLCLILLLVCHEVVESQSDAPADEKSCSSHDGASTDSSTESCVDPSSEEASDDHDEEEDDCARMMRGPMIWGPGDLNRMFQRIVTDSYYQDVYGPLKVLSFANQTRSGKGGADNEIAAPWIVQIDNFLSVDECDTLIDFGYRIGYEFSTIVDDSHAHVRKSSTAWCLDPCKADPLIQRILHRISNLTGIPATHTEPLQLLRYQPHQFYQRHHDFLDHHLHLVPMGRIVTVMIYLNTLEKDSGGETYFPELDLKIRPQLGRVVVWPNVRNESPVWDADPRLEHEALPLKEGKDEKYAMNAWLHQRDCDSPYEKGCL